MWSNKLCCLDLTEASYLPSIASVLMGEWSVGDAFSYNNPFGY